MSTKLASNKQAEQSLDIQTIDVPADLRPTAITNPAIIALCRLEGGGLVEELAQAMVEVAGASYNLTKKGKITLTLNFKPNGARKMGIVASITKAVPQEERADTTLFVTPDGQLLAHDPDQQRMDLRVVKTHDVQATRVIDVEEKPPLRVVS
jgi:hypothetical protein